MHCSTTSYVNVSRLSAVIDWAPPAHTCAKSCVNDFSACVCVYACVYACVSGTGQQRCATTCSSRSAHGRRLLRSHMCSVCVRAHRSCVCECVPHFIHSTQQRSISCCSRKIPCKQGVKRTQSGAHTLPPLDQLAHYPNAPRSPYRGPSLSHTHTVVLHK